MLYKHLIPIPSYQNICYNKGGNVMENKTVRDTTFRHYFNGGHGNGNSNYRLLSLANTLKGTNYTAPDAIQINTLDGSFFSSLKNDISFLFDNRWMILLEHQSTINEKVRQCT